MIVDSKIQRATLDELTWGAQIPRSEDQAAIDGAALEDAIEEALKRRAARLARRIGVDASDGVVTLRGPVHSWYERRAVLGTARQAPGVCTVVDNLYIDPEA